MKRVCQDIMSRMQGAGQTAWIKDPDSGITLGLDSYARVLAFEAIKLIIVHVPPKAAGDSTSQCMWST